MIFLILRLHGTDSKMRASFIQVLTDNHLDYLIKNECSKLPSVETKKSSISLGNIILNGKKLKSRVSAGRLHSAVNSVTV